MADQSDKFDEAEKAFADAVASGALPPLISDAPSAFAPVASRQPGRPEGAGAGTPGAPDIPISAESILENDPNTDEGQKEIQQRLLETLVEIRSILESVLVRGE